MGNELRFVCLEMPGAGDECVFVECEDANGNGVSAGEWRQRAAGLAELVVKLPADPGEVERLRTELEGYKQGSHIEAEEADSLRAQLAERDALLDRVVDHAKFWHDHPYAEVVEAIAKDYKALSASAEPSAPTEDDYCPSGIVEAAIHGQIVKLPSAPIERDERAAFESEWWGRLDLSRDKLSGCYYSPATEWRWEGWQARAGYGSRKRAPT